jgi:acyl-coenzyme A thioesterase PaaI-like protein
VEPITRGLDSRSCFVCGKGNPLGLQLEFFAEEQRVRAMLLPRPEHQGWPGFVHQGIVMAVLDETIGRAAGLLEAAVLTGRVEFRFRQPAPLDQELTFVGSLVADRGQALEMEGFAQLPDGSIVAEGRGLYMRISTELRQALEEQVDAGQ